jgi:hypothetical protein
MKYRFFHRARVNAPLEIAWDVFTDHRRYGEFTNASMTIVQIGSPDSNGLGCIRRMIAPDHRLDEIVNIWRPLSVFGYHVIGCDTFEAHQGVVRFFPIDDNRCEWLYDMQIVPGAASIAAAREAGLDFRSFIAPGFDLLMRDFEAECERRADGERVAALPPSTAVHALPS